MSHGATYSLKLADYNYLRNAEFMYEVVHKLNCKICDLIPVCLPLHIYNTGNKERRGPQIWNQLDDTLKMSRCISIFKENLKKQPLSTYIWLISQVHRWVIQCTSALCFLSSMFPSAQMLLPTGCHAPSWFPFFSPSHAKLCMNAENVCCVSVLSELSQLQVVTWKHTHLHTTWHRMWFILPAPPATTFLLEKYFRKCAKHCLACCKCLKT